MTASQWVFVGGLAVIMMAVAVVGTITWQQRESSSSILGFAFVLIALVSTVNLTMTAHKVRVSNEEMSAELGRQLACDEKILSALWQLDEQIFRAIRDGSVLPPMAEIPAC